MNMGKKLFASYMVFVLIIGIIVSTDYYDSKMTKKHTVEIAELKPLNDVIQNLSYDFLMQRNSINQYIVSKDLAALDTYREYHLKAEKDITHLKDFTNKFPEISTEIEAAIMESRQQNKALNEIVNQAVFEGVQDSKILFSNSRHQDDEFLFALNNLQNKTQNIIRNSLNKMVQQSEDLHQFNYLLLILSLPLGVILGYVLSKRYTNPIRKLIKATAKDENGNYKTIHGVLPKDEVGILATAFNDMVITINNEHSLLKEQNLKLLSQQEEMSAQNEEIRAQQEELSAILDQVNAEQDKLLQLHEFNTLLNESIELTVLSDTILRYCLKAFKADAGALLVKDPDEEAIYIAASAGLDASVGETIPMDNLRGLVKRCYLEQQSIIVSYPATEVSAGIRLAETQRSAHEVYVPFTFNSQKLGFIILSKLSGNRFHDNEVTLLEAQMSQGAMAINNALVYKRIEKMYEDILEQAALVEQLNAQLETEKDNLSRAREITRSVVESINEAIVMVNIDDEVVAVNKRWQELFEYEGDLRGSSSEVLFRTSIDCLENSAEAYNKLTEIMAHPMNQGEFNAVQENRVLRVWTGPVLDRAENLIGRLYVFRDITIEAEVDRMKSEFVSTVSHELRTPLSSILGFSELLLIKKLSEEARTKYTKTIHKEAKRLTDLVNDFLDLQRMELGKQVYDKEDFIALDLLAEVVESFAASGVDHDITLQTVERFFINADKERVTQVLINLLSNAVKFSPKGTKITLGVTPDEEYAKFFIKDQGLGIPKDVQDNLFSKFYRVDNSDRRKIGGTGLGLSICKEIVEAHGGKIWVESEHGHGSVFYFTVKLSEKSITGDAEINSAPRLQKDKSIKRVLLVEDDRSLALLFKEHLADCGYRVEVRATGEEALKTIKHSKPDVIILDILLAGEMNGWTILQTLKQDKSTENIPIIVSSCLPEKEQALALGANEYLIKPFEPQLLIRIVKDLLSREKDSQTFMIVPKNQKVSQLLVMRLKEKGFFVKDIIDEKEAILVSMDKPID
ncbi:GAF sensor hybrid histidine kinase [Desulforamulus reducens MI-1]|uniref:Stage 0 sporulation protein A homolog n=1 Tax=Desulforamulus reducens (strain ATCC BAA-1160 / DSM 100696 / MI-1) TaxID=349161 RepID=A4J4T1_DESRM|nr:ATP-binding protein [Desulforamulus reducens]ABO50084.1 GAF sensor hybrid histidine kinase [Desulforamulus reducens MI-1]